MKVLGVTLARGGSKGVPGKNIRPLGGVPLIAHTVREARLALSLTEYCVSSDSGEILSVALDAGAQHLIKRPDELAQDDTPHLPALQHAVLEMEKRLGERYEIVADIRATSPFKTAADIDAMVRLLFTEEVDSVIGVTELGDHHPARAKRIINGFIRPYCVAEPKSGRRQDLKPPAYIRNGTVYVLARAALEGPAAAIFGQSASLAYVMPPERSLNIDSEMDFILAEALWEKQCSRG